MISLSVKGINISIYQVMLLALTPLSHEAAGKLGASSDSEEGLRNKFKSSTSMQIEIEREGDMKKLILLFMAIALFYPQRSAGYRSPYTPPPASARVLEGINFTSTSPVDESYRGEFDRCDRENIFRGVRM